MKTCSVMLLMVALASASATAHAVAALEPAAAAPVAEAVAPRRDPAPRSDGPRCRGEAAAPGHLALQLGKSTLLRLPEPVMHRSVGNPAVLQAMLVAAETLYLVGVDVGSTNMIVQGRSGNCSVIEVAVALDVGALQATLAAVLPDEKDIRVTAAADSLVLAGTVSDGGTLARVLELAQAYVRRPARPVGGKGEEGNGGGGNGGSGSRIVNLLGISAPQQVMLEVKIAEVSKTLLDKLEAGTAVRLKSGEWTASLLANFLSGALKTGINVAKSPYNQLQLDAERNHGLVRLLAEPTIMAISGQEGSFLAGGKIFVPVAQDNNKVTLEEKEFGVGLRFTPTVLAGGRINLRVAPEVSELSRDGVGISANGIGGAIMPLITTRRATTTVQLFDGQSFAIGGLIRNNQVSNIDALPGLGEVPVLGTLFRSTDFQHDRSELLFVVTAHLVKPLPAGYALPTDALQPASGAALMIGGRMEAAPPAAPAAQPQPPSQFQLK